MTKLRLHPKLQASIDQVSYDARQRVGRLNMRAGHCCDMTACVLLFSGIDTGVRRIETYSGDRLEDVYERCGRGWVAAARGRSTSQLSAF